MFENLSIPTRVEKDLLTPYSTSAQNPHAFVMAEDLPNASYRIVT
jgi:hypothetical protein